MVHSEFSIQMLLERLQTKAFQNKTPQKYAGDMFEAAEVILQLQKEKAMADSRLRQLSALAAGAEEVNQHCVWNANEMNAFRAGLQAALDILNAKGDGTKTAAKIRKTWAVYTGTQQEHWTAEGLVPNQDWILDLKGEEK